MDREIYVGEMGETSEGILSCICNATYGQAHSRGCPQRDTPVRNEPQTEAGEVISDGVEAECPSCDDSWAAHIAGLHEEAASPAALDVTAAELAILDMADSLHLRIQVSALHPTPTWRQMAETFAKHYAARLSPSEGQNSTDLDIQHTMEEEPR